MTDGTLIWTWAILTQVRLFLGLGKFLDQTDTVWCVFFFNLQIIFTGHSYYAETYPSLWVVFKSSEVSIHAFTTSVHCLAFFGGATNSLELRMLYNTRTDTI